MMRAQPGFAPAHDVPIPYLQRTRAYSREARRIREEAGVGDPDDKKGLTR
jgi:hypothetical protein